MNSDADEFSAIKISGTANGNITYNRFVNYAASGEWDLIGSPVDGLSISAFINTNTSGNYCPGTAPRRNAKTKTNARRGVSSYRKRQESLQPAGRRKTRAAEKLKLEKTENDGQSKDSKFVFS